MLKELTKKNEETYNVSQEGLNKTIDQMMQIAQEIFSDIQEKSKSVVGVKSEQGVDKTEDAQVKLARIKAQEKICLSIIDAISKLSVEFKKVDAFVDIMSKKIKSDLIKFYEEHEARKTVREIRYKKILEEINNLRQMVDKLVELAIAGKDYDLLDRALEFEDRIVKLINSI